MYLLVKRSYLRYRKRCGFVIVKNWKNNFVFGLLLRLRNFQIFQKFLILYVKSFLYQVFQERHFWFWILLKIQIFLWCPNLTFRQFLTILLKYSYISGFDHISSQNEWFYPQIWYYSFIFRKFICIPDIFRIFLDNFQVFNFKNCYHNHCRYIFNDIFFLQNSRFFQIIFKYLISTTVFIIIRDLLIIFFFDFNNCYQNS